MSKTPTATATLYENLGHGIIALVRVLPSDLRYEDEIALGKQVDALIRAAHKASVPGRQSNKQIVAGQHAARQAFARALARKVAAL